MKNSYSLIKMGILMPSWNALKEEDIVHGTFFNDAKVDIRVSTFTNSDKISIGGTDYTPMDIYVGFETPSEAYHLVVGNIGTFNVKIGDMFDVEKGSSLSRNIKSDFTKSDKYCVLVNAEMKLLRSEDFIISFILSGDDINIHKKDIYVKFDWGTETDFVINVFNHETKGNRYSVKAEINNENGITREIKTIIPFERIIDLIDIKYLYNANEIIFDTELMYRNIKLSKKIIRINPFYQGTTASVVTGLKLLGYSVKRAEKAFNNDKDKDGGKNV